MVGGIKTPFYLIRRSIMKKPTQAKRVPLAFIDKTGFVTPFNGRLDTTLSGWYLYTQEEVDAALAQQRTLEQNRITTERGVVDTHYAIDDVEVEQSGYEQTEDDTPDWAQKMFGLENTAPYLQLSKPENAPDPIKTDVVTVDHLHQKPSGVDLTPEQIAELQGTATNPTDIVKQVFGNN